MTEPSAQDLRNAACRAEIAAKQNAVFAEAERLALATLGPGWHPWMALRLIDSEYHRTGNSAPVAVAYKVYRGEHRTTENSVYLRRMPDGTVLKADNYEPLFGDLLDEKHPTKRFEIKGETVAAPRWSLTWSALERYEPRSADQLAALRESRERGKAAKEQVAFERENPLLVWMDRVEDDGIDDRGRSK